MAGLGGRYRGAHSFVISHFADHDYVNIFSKSRPNGAVERDHIGAQFTLVNNTLVRSEDVLDWILDGNYFFRPFLVDQVDDGRHRRGFAVAVRSDDEDETLREAREELESWREIEFFDGFDILGNHPKGSG